MELQGYLLRDRNLCSANQAASADFKGTRHLYGSFGSAPVPLKLVPLESSPVQKPGAHNYDDLLHDLIVTFILFSLVILGTNKLHLIFDKN